MADAIRKHSDARLAATDQKVDIRDFKLVDDSTEAKKRKDGSAKGEKASAESVIPKAPILELPEGFAPLPPPPEVRVRPAQMQACVRVCVHQLEG